MYNKTSSGAFKNYFAARAMEDQDEVFIENVTMFSSSYTAEYYGIHFTNSIFYTYNGSSSVKRDLNFYNCTVSGGTFYNVQEAIPINYPRYYY